MSTVTPPHQSARPPRWDEVQFWIPRPSDFVLFLVLTFLSFDISYRGPAAFFLFILGCAVPMLWRLKYPDLVALAIIPAHLIQLAFGVADNLEDDQEAAPFSSSGNIRCWVYGELRNSGNNAEKLAHFCVMGDLSLTNSPNFASDPVTCEFELSIKNSPLATFTSLALAKLAAD